LHCALSRVNPFRNAGVRWWTSPSEAAMKIVVNEQIHLSPFVESDKPRVVEHLNDRDMYERTSRIPFPYTAADADRWFALAAKLTEEQGQPVQLAIRTATGEPIGALGFNDFQLGKSHKADIGYWLAKPYWGRGITTAVVQRMCQHGFDQFGLVKITAHVFTFNPASARVLEKSGFVQEGLLRKHFLKDDKFVDAWLFALLK
jgi:RimJ/RimL family protein N-acetyltransferase